MPSLDTKTIRHLIESIKTSPKIDPSDQGESETTESSFRGSGSELIRTILRRSQIPSQVAAKIVDEQIKPNLEIQQSAKIPIEDGAADPREAMEAVFIETKTVSMVDRIRSYFTRAA